MRLAHVERLAEQRAGPLVTRLGRWATTARLLRHDAAPSSSPAVAVQLDRPLRARPRRASRLPRQRCITPSALCAFAAAAAVPPGRRQRVAQPRHALAPSRSDVPEPLQSGRRGAGPCRWRRRCPAQRADARRLAGSAAPGRAGRATASWSGPAGPSSARSTRSTAHSLTSLARELATVGLLELVRGRTGGSSRTCSIRDAGAGAVGSSATGALRPALCSEVEVRRRSRMGGSPHTPSPPRSTRRRRTRRARRTPPAPPAAGAGSSTPARRACSDAAWARRCGRC